MLTDGQQGPWPIEWVARLMALILLTVLPLVAVVFGFEYECAKTLAEQRESQARQFEESASFLLEKNFSEDFLQNLIGSVYFSHRHTPAPALDLARAMHEDLTRLQERFPGLIEAAFFDGESRFLAQYSDLSEVHGLLSTFGTDFSRCFTGDFGPFNTRLPQYRTFLGPFADEFSPLRLQTGTYVYSQFVSFLRRRAFLAISPYKPGLPWFLALFSLPQDTREFTYLAWLKTRRQQWTAPFCTIVSLDQPPETWGQGLGEAGPAVTKGLLALGDREGKAAYAEGFCWLRIPVSRHKILVGAIPDRAQIEYSQTTRQIRLGALTVFGLLILLGLAGQRFVTRELPLRTKILALFAYATGVPIFLLALCAHGLFAERRQLIERRVFSEEERALRDFDRSIVEFFGRIEQLCLKRFGCRLPTDSAPLQSLLDRVTALQNAVNPAICELYDASGKSLFHFSRDPTQAYEKLAPLFGMQIGRIVALRNQTTAPAMESAREQALSASLESMGINIDELSSLMADSFDHLVFFKPGDENLGLLCLPFRDAGGNVQFVLLVAWGEREVGKTFVRRRWKTLQDRRPGFLLGSLLPGGCLVPETLPAAQALRNLALLLNSQPTPVQKTLVENGQTYLATVIKGRHLDWPFSACATDERVREDIHQTRIRLTLLGILLMSLGTGIGLMISRYFLRPVGLLAGGLEAMRQRDFSKRVPVLSADEFGEVSHTFNRMMEGMADLEIARVVQDTFFPRQPLIGNGWEVFGTSVSASRVGGDYFDYLPLPDGRWLVLIGDVSGHGVPAALVVAMAKALLFHPGNPSRPAEILDLLNGCLLRSLKRKRMMSCFLGVFDPRSASLVCCNAGHNYPALVTSTTATEVRLISCPLGMRQKERFVDHPEPLRGVTYFCLYTDGLIEAVDRQGNMIGYERFFAALPALARPTARATEAAIRDWFDSLAAPGPQADDTTLVILQPAAPADVKG